MVFNNGADRGYSSVDEITPPLNPDGTYELDPIAPFGPVELSDSCDTIDGQPFFSNTGSSAQRLANGNILIGLFEGDAIEIDDACLSVTGA